MSLMHQKINEARDAEVINKLYEGSAIAGEHNGAPSGGDSHVDWWLFARGDARMGGSLAISGDSTDSTVVSTAQKPAAGVLESMQGPMEWSHAVM